VLVQPLALAALCASRQDLKNIEHQHIRTMVLSDMNCTPQEFICMVHGRKICCTWRRSRRFRYIQLQVLQIVTEFICH
jgi:hypothetical protein